MIATSEVFRFGVALLLCLSSTLLAIVPSEQKVWKSADGREIKAVILELDGDSETVKMRRIDGQVFTIEFEKFAAEDAATLKKLSDQQTSKKESPPEEEEKEEEALEPVELPRKLELDDVPMIVQKHNYCVPASAAMIAGYHEIETNQDQIAFLSSGKSFGSQGTSPRDMLLAMQKLGFDGKAHYWRKPEDFSKNVLPAIREALVNQGPIYISFSPGVFGDSGHGCIIVGYNHRKEYLIFHNPWGNVFEKDYEQVAKQSRGVVFIEAPDPAPIASDAMIERVKALISSPDLTLNELTNTLSRGGQKNELVWCSRRDARDDKRFAEDTARDDGRTILDLAFHRNPAVIIPGNDDDGKTTEYLFVTRPPEGGSRFLVRGITNDGWTEPELRTLGSMTRNWATLIASKGSEKYIWELPMIELHPGD